MANSLNVLARGRTLIHGSNTCSIKRSGGDASAYTTPVSAHPELACSNVYEISQEEVEKAGLGSITRPCRIFVKVPSSGVIQQHDKLTTNSQEYLVVSAKKWPHQNETHYELIMDFQR